MKIFFLKLSLLVLIFVLETVTSFGQGFSEGFNYQAILRSSAGLVLNQEPVTVRVGIIATSLSGTLVYEEDHLDTTSSNGLAQLIIGQGTPTGSSVLADFSMIAWSSGDYFVNIKIDVGNVGVFTDVSTSQFFSVPYAIHSRTSSQEYSLSTLTDVDTSNIEIGQTLVWNGVGWISSNIDTVNFAQHAGTAIYSDTSNYSVFSDSSMMANSTAFSFFSDSASYAISVENAINSNSAVYADTAQYALNCLNSWDLNGNTLVGSEFIGSINAADVIFKTDSTERMRITSDGKIGVNSASPIADFEINGNNGFLFSGTHGSGVSQVFTGDRLVYYPKKATSTLEEGLLT